MLRRVVIIRDDAAKRHGELTLRGAQQHQGIGARMVERFPEVFEGKTHVDAKSTVVIRCILSMENALHSLIRKNPELDISHDASEHDMWYMNLSDRELDKKKMPKDIEEVLGKAESAMQPSVYDPLGYGKREQPVDPYSYATTETSKTKTAIKDTEVYTVTDNGVTEQEASKYTGLNAALSGVLERAERFANALLSDYSPINILIVEQLPETGADRTFYLIPKESGTGYDKWWYITDERGNKKWDKFGSSSTLIVTELPQEADSDVDYILDANGEYQYCKYIDGAWHVIAGSNAKIIEYPDNHLPEKTYFGKGTTPDQSIAYLDSYSWYLDTETMTIYAISYNAGTGRYSFTDPIVLVAEPSESKDYYILDAAQTYEHFRVIGSKFEQIGSSAYTRAEVDEKVRAINSEISDNAGRIGANAQNINAQLQIKMSNNPTDREDQIVLEICLDHLLLGLVPGHSQFVLPATGGGGGSSTTTTMTVDRITESPIICTPTDKVIIEVDYSSVDSDGEQVDGTYSIRRGSNVVMSGTVNQGRNSFDVTDANGKKTIINKRPPMPIDITGRFV